MEQRSRFAEYIEQFKADMGLTNQDIARIMDVGSMTFKNYLSGYAPPSQQAMARLLTALALRPDDGDKSLVLPKSKLPFRTVDLAELDYTVNSGGAFGIEIREDNLTKKKLYPGGIALVRRCAVPADGSILCLSIDGGGYCFRSFSESGDSISLWDDRGCQTMTREEFDARVRIIGRVTAVAENMSK